ncbi:MAG: DUF1998 domain-containing protein [Deltaproteobacteria bacterium]|nr:DUF1998 domain-containing protein [Deltaproteobacteria bacterium]
MKSRRVPANRPSVQEQYVPVRLSHLLRHCSVGAIVRDSNHLMVVPDIRDWDRPGDDPLKRQIRYVDQVRNVLGIDKPLCTPPVARDLDDGRKSGWIPVRRFPLWTRCLQCGLLHRAPWRGQQDDADRCQGQGPEDRPCGGRLEQVPWVLVHQQGFLADVPWHILAHADDRNPNQHQCKPDRGKPYLRLVEQAGRQVVCTRCRSRGDIHQRHPFPRTTWQQPWVHKPPVDPDHGEPAWLLQLNDVRVHAPVNRTALVIPPESRIRRGTVVDRLYSHSRNQQRIRNAKTPLARKTALRRVSSEYNCTVEEIEEALKDIAQGYPLYGRTVTQGDLMASEYKALTGEIPDLKEDEDFVTVHHTSAWKALAAPSTVGGARPLTVVDRLVAVHRLKEIMVLMGFRRAGGEHLTPPDITGDCDWLPALELYGEGVFLTLDETCLRRWECNTAISERAAAFVERYHHRDSHMEVEVSPRFLLCHTLAHVLIRRIEAEAGYPAASLKERIYCKTGKDAMAGVLIYVAVTDEEGSLGGLMELARPERFLRLLTGAFEDADWCSLDPVCSEQEGHGPDLLNRAACHACALVPETSCQYGNVLLDRIFIKGAVELPGFLDRAGAPD